MNELAVQRELVKAAQIAKGHAFKCNNRFLVGVPDLSVQLPGYRHAFIEVKYEKSFNSRNYVKINLTPHQKRFINTHNEAGGCAGWCVVVGEGGEYWIFASTITDYDKASGTQGPWFHKARGLEWPISKIVNRLSLLQHPISRIAGESQP